ncbi:MAG: peptide chain release factor 2 [Candidatus Komeilibacteria bacterium RIFCSPLOWO2_01_FULL_53_11]|uniref:Peptide chain release factor 2 n=1 Tax=Candidatus Komeilibacteria bacterium RIFCSPLOWO2_01_FULL_53_11 TaxID=1798552 RepID=A0A1G2BPN6_9BACT|nr:MAG: peptide chain release factor 2 [Candidatus Komeilibacteria bacterium RIFCSPLOWO2_01_FULL_53_11]
MDELLKATQHFLDRVKALQASFHLNEKRTRSRELTEVMHGSDFWKDRVRAEAISREAAELERWLTFWDNIQKRGLDVRAIAEADRDDQSLNMRTELENEIKELERELDEKELELFLSEPHDGRPAIVTIYSGAGGVDAQDWAEMLERMYLRFAARQKWKTAVLNRTPGQGAGIKNVTIRCDGSYAYGYLKNESGVHRLVRLSPYDADHARHTSFAMVEVLPELEESLLVTIADGDVRIDVFRSSGHGGQSVNTTDSAVRLTHLPTGITVVCQNERSQLQNKQQAWRMLLGKLERYYQAKRDEERQQLRGEFTENAWGSQIRSYVIHPYKLVKDHRTKHESGDPESVLEGDLMPFIEAELRRQLRETH